MAVLRRDDSPAIPHEWIETVAQALPKRPNGTPRYYLAARAVMSLVRACVLVPRAEPMQPLGDLLARVEAEAAAAWRSRDDALSLLNDEQQGNEILGEQLCEARKDITDLRARIEALHYRIETQSDGSKCHECWKPWPCRTVAALVLPTDGDTE